MDNWVHVLELQKEMFTIHIDWTYEDAPICVMFDDTICDIDEMEQLCERGIDSHYMTRVSVFFEGLKIEELIVGSCYASGISPDEDIENEYKFGYISDFVDTAMENARDECKNLAHRLNESFA